MIVFSSLTSTPSAESSDERTAALTDEAILIVEVTRTFASPDSRCLHVEPKDRLVCFIQREAPPGWFVAHRAEHEERKVGLVPISYTCCLRLVPPSSPIQLLVDFSGLSRMPSREPAFAEPPQGCFPNEGGLRQRTWAFLNHPQSSQGAFIWSHCMTLFISGSVALIVVQTLPFFWEGEELLHPAFWDACEVGITLLFTAEYVLRLWSCDGPRCRFVAEPLNLVDVVAIAPFYIEEIVSQLFEHDINSQWLRVLRLVRLARILKLGKRSKGLQMFGVTMVRSSGALFVQGMLMGLAGVLVASLAYFAEQGTWDAERREWLGIDGQPSAFTSIPKSLWWASVTMTTVGYGDMVPLTNLGRTVALVAMCVGVLSIAMPVTVVASNFHQQYLLQKALHDGRAENPHAILSEYGAQLAELRQLLVESRLLLVRIRRLSAAANARLLGALHRQQLVRLPATPPPPAAAAARSAPPPPREASGARGAASLEGWRRRVERAERPAAGGLNLRAKLDAVAGVNARVVLL
ncbi:hypothetical protein AB1Y20_013680 [Prymnesium parvum]|uniref:Ion transport domain-containing protein n=1 Tax=Prymnesium parvum TaxID=97485 RepID=A0AB34IIG1_PRYPA